MNQQIRSLDDAKRFFRDLQARGLLFHPEDNPHTVVNARGDRVFTVSEAERLLDRMSEVYMFMADPCAYVVEIKSC